MVALNLFVNDFFKIEAMREILILKVLPARYAIENMLNTVVKYLRNSSLSVVYNRVYKRVYTV